MISRRRALVLLGLSGALGLAAPSLLPTPGQAQEDKPLPGEGGGARTSPQLDKPIPSEQTGTRPRIYRRRPLHERRINRHRRRRRHVQPRQPGSPEHKAR